MKTPIALVLAALAFAAGYFWGQQQTLDAALGERLTGIETKLADLEKAKPAARPNEPKPLAPAEAMKLIAVDSAPTRGAPKGGVTIVEYGDFQCPFCLRSRPVIKQVMDTYPEQVRLVYKHFPLSFHREAMNAHRAAEAAREQDKFWEMHDRIFQALKHQLADMALAVEPSRALVWYAAHAFDAIPAEAPRAAALAKAHLTDVYMQVARDTVEAHGGIGFTWESDVQIWYKRAMFDRAFLGTPAAHRERAARLAGW